MFNAHKTGFLTGRLNILALTQISCKGDHLTLIFFLQPFQDDGRIQPT